MNIEKLLAHHDLYENPFEAEEARHDRIFERLIDQSSGHPDFGKILGIVSRPNTSVVFGEKGSGKTAIRLMIGRRIEHHNEENPNSRILLVAYDELNPVLDRVADRYGKRRQMFRRSGDEIERLLQKVRLEDHQDAILARAVRKVNDALLGESENDRERMILPDKAETCLAELPVQMRHDLAVLTALYDRPRSGSILGRFDRLKAMLKLGRQTPGWLMTGGALILLLIGLVLGTVWQSMGGFGTTETPNPNQDAIFWMLPVGGACLLAGVVVGLMKLASHLTTWSLARRLKKEMLAVDRPVNDMMMLLRALGPAARASQPWPVPSVSSQEARYELTEKLLAILNRLHYTGMMVLVDRMDEPTLVAGKSGRMKAVVWPMLDNKFLQQTGIGFKLLLPLELRHLLHRESADFFQEARLDKQSMIDRLTWTGAVLYDLCSNRLRACRNSEPEGIKLTDLFEEEVDEEMLMESLDQMGQPRDAFKFLYSVLLEHCRSVPDDQARFRIPRLVLDTVRRQQSQRVQELQRGLTPA